MAAQPGFEAGGQAFAEGAGPVVEGSGELVGDGRGTRGHSRGCAGPGGVVPLARQGELLQAVVEDADDGPGVVHRRGGDLVDHGADVVLVELGGAEPLAPDLTGVLTVVPPGFGFGKPGFDPLVDVGVQGLLDGGDP